MNVKDGFPTTILALVDRETRLPLATIFMDCNVDPEYTDYLESRFNYNGYYNYELSSTPTAEEFDLEKFCELNLYEQREIRQKIFSKKLEKLKQYLQEEYGFSFPKGVATVEVNKQKSMGLFYNDTDKRWSAFKTYEEKYRLAQKMDFNYYIDEDNSCSLGINKVIPFIDASHELRSRRTEVQGDKEVVLDNNHFLYNLNFIRAITTYLEIPGNLEKVLDFARQGEQASLLRVFSMEIREHLPMYYNVNGDKRSEDEIVQFHLRQRWDLDSENLSTEPKHVFNKPLRNSPSIAT
ncbi:MAG: hypothetical protein RLZ35_1146 [Pseudomonadota bacterium]